MSWSNAAAYFFGGVFLANFVPHFVAGVSGRWFFSPFANPPFRGRSPPAVNVVYGLFNLSVAYTLLMIVGSFELHRAAHAALGAAGFGLASLGIASSVGKLQSSEGRD